MALKKEINFKEEIDLKVDLKEEFGLKFDLEKEFDLKEEINLFSLREKSTLRNRLTSSPWGRGQTQGRV